MVRRMMTHWNVMRYGNPVTLFNEIFSDALVIL